jgi:hypothetical protein
MLMGCLLTFGGAHWSAVPRSAEAPAPDVGARDRGLGTLTRVQILPRCLLTRRSPNDLDGTHMSDQLIDVRTRLAASPRTRVEIGQDGVLHVLAGHVTLHLERAVCEELTTTLARAMVLLTRSEPKRPAAGLSLVSRAPALPQVLPSEAEPAALRGNEGHPLDLSLISITNAAFAADSKENS